ncbi:PREDICTED: olfactory receptor 6B1-like [Nanorana parkeri]|uniref:olfactory receptor 6B1-like n=1 Tax=Nanorana parkeri TaxID=125878 RepID=UPI000854C1A8|nr:PREDICTED: olfactory receptor 6B1-like [Nanorana parkeri]
MEAENQSTVIEFILLGLTDDLNLQLWLFQFFSLVYMTTLAGNILLIVAVRTDHRLHNSMYLFLASLSFLDICYTSIIVPKMLLNIVLSTKTISYTGCVLQVYFYLFMGETECILLAFMAYDRYVAICNPLHYNVIMNTVSCVRMIAVAWTAGGSIASMDIYFMSQLRFCGPITINHFFCEAHSLLQASCGDIYVNNIVTLVGGSILLLIPLCLILFSYIQIVLVVMKLPSGRYKAFSTCISHLIVVTIFYGTAIFMYMRPRYSDTDVTDKMVSVFYTIVTPMLNPLIYSLRNKDVQKALGQLGRCCHVCGKYNNWMTTAE